MSSSLSISVLNISNILFLLVLTIKVAAGTIKSLVDEDEDVDIEML